MFWFASNWISLIRFAIPVRLILLWCPRAVSDHRESVLIWIPKMLRMSESVRDNRFAGTGCLAPILLIYESVLSAR
jgi:hypothetical protein